MSKKFLCATSLRIVCTMYVGEGDSGGVGGEVVLVVVAWRGGREAVLCVVHNAGRD